MEGDGRAKDVLQKEKRAQQTSVIARTKGLCNQRTPLNGDGAVRDADASEPDKAGHPRGKIVEECFTYVNPEAPFDDFNTRLTGISAETVCNAPTFPELWQQIVGAFYRTRYQLWKERNEQGISPKILLNFRHSPIHIYGIT